MKLTPEDQHSDESLSRQTTRRLIIRLGLITVGTPVILIVAIAFLADFLQIELAHRHLKHIIMLLWLSTLLLLGVFIWFNRRGTPGRQPLRSAELVEQHLSSADIAQTWELRNARRIGRELFLALFLLPFLSLILVWGYFTFQAIFITRRDWLQIVGITWLGSLLALVKGVFFSKQPRMLAKHRNVKAGDHSQK